MYQTISCFGGWKNKESTSRRAVFWYRYSFEDLCDQAMFSFSVIFVIKPPVCWRQKSAREIPEMFTIEPFFCWWSNYLLKIKMREIIYYFLNQIFFKCYLNTHNAHYKFAILLCEISPKCNLNNNINKSAPFINKDSSARTYNFRRLLIFLPHITSVVHYEY